MGRTAVSPHWDEENNGHDMPTTTGVLQISWTAADLNRAAASRSCNWRRPVVASKNVSMAPWS